MWTDVYPWIRQTLRSAGSELLDAEFDLTIASVARSILAPRGLSYPSIVDAADKAALDEAIGLLTSVRLWPGLVTDGLAGWLESAKDDDASENYGGQKEMLAAWTAQANQALRATSFGGNFVGGAASFGGVNGPSRNRCRDYPRSVDGYRGRC